MALRATLQPDMTAAWTLHRASSTVTGQVQELERLQPVCRFEVPSAAVTVVVYLPGPGGVREIPVRHCPADSTRAWSCPSARVSYHASYMHGHARTRTKMCPRYASSVLTDPEAWSPTHDSFKTDREPADVRTSSRATPTFRAYLVVQDASSSARLPAIAAGRGWTWFDLTSLEAAASVRG